MLKRIARFIIWVYLLPVKLVQDVKKREKLLGYFCRVLDDKKHYVNFRLVPKFTISDFCTTEVAKSNEIGILIQGPIDDSITILAINMYKNNYPGISVIVSTWDDLGVIQENKLIDMGVYLVKSKKPVNAGVLNVNFQIVSTLAGIKKAKQIGVKYIAKTRSDQFFYKKDVLYSLKEMLDIFPSAKSSEGIKRIIALPTYFGNMFTPFFMSDFFYFGAVEDMEKMFSVELDNRIDLKISSDLTRRQYAEKEYAPEIYLMKNYTKKVNGEQIENTLDSYWSSLKDYFICIDREFIGLYSDKYWYSRMDHINNNDYFVDNRNVLKNTASFSFAKWLNLCSGQLVYDLKYEAECDVKFGL